MFVEGKKQVVEKVEKSHKPKKDLQTDVKNFEWINFQRPSESNFGHKKTVLIISNNR